MEAKRGNDVAFARLWREYNPMLLRYLSVRSGMEADDLTADAWHSAVRSLRNFEGDEPHFKAWLFTIARNRLTDWYRGNGGRVATVDPVELAQKPNLISLEEVAEDNSATDRALGLIAQLPPDQAEVVMLRFVNGLDIALIAQVMNRSPGAVRVLSHRGLKSLHSMLESAETSPETDPTRSELGEGHDQLVEVELHA
jgi:RNA polymerase sigma-70 factor (ECF subfamily)